MKHFKAGLLWEQNRQKPLKLQENSLSGPFYKTQEPKHRQQKTKTPKNKKNIPKKHPFAFWQTTPYFCKIFVVYQGTFFQVYKAVFAENTIKIVFSAKHSFQASQIVKPLFEGKPKMALLQPKVPFWVFPCVRWNPYFCSVWWLLMGTKKKWHFPKTDSCNENAHFFLPSEHR